MRTKDGVLKVLKENRGKFISGQEIADSIFVTRASVWKAVKTLQNDGYAIEAITNKGYRLKQSISKIDPEDIREALKTEGIDLDVFYYEEIDNTNDEALRLSRRYNKELVVISEGQRYGRGRRGRVFFSPNKSGLYISFLLRPEGSIEDSVGVTAIAAIATAEGIDNAVFDGKDTTKIKWVNDIFFNDKKISGILTEAYYSMEEIEDNKIIVGIGINVFEPEEGFPKEISETAGAVLEYERAYDGVKTYIAVEVIKRFVVYSKQSGSKALTDKYREKSNLIGRYVVVNSYGKNTDNKKYAEVIGISDDYHLIVRYENGKTEELSSGEVSVVKY